MYMYQYLRYIGKVSYQHCFCATLYLPVDVIKNDVIHNRTVTSFFIVTTLQHIFIVVRI